MSTIVVTYGFRASDLHRGGLPHECSFVVVPRDSGSEERGESVENRQRIRRTVLIVLALIAGTVAGVLWAIRPTHIFQGRLALGRSDEVPSERFVAWTRGHEAPWTPIGFLSVFDPVDLVIAAALFVVGSFLVFLLIATWSDGSTQLLARIRAPISWPPSFKVGVRAAMIAVALVALELGWEVNGWKTWELREVYFKKFTEFKSAADGRRAFARTLRELIDRVDNIFPNARFDEFRTPEAIEAQQAKALDGLKRDLANAEKELAYFDELRKKYERAAAHPRDPIERDPPFPSREHDAQASIGSRDFTRALAALDEEIRRYPGLWDAHNRRAHILATCPDVSVRNGNAAVRSATRACELTRWHSPQALDTLAAAYAEAGDFKSAVAWEKKALERMRLLPGLRMQAQARLALYEAGEPFREER